MAGRAVDEAGHQKRRYVPRTTSRVLLVGATIELLRELPFDEVTVRKIAERAGLNTKAIMNIFGSQEGLFIEVAGELSRRFAEFLAAQPEEQIYEGVPIQADFVLRTQLVAWLIAQGADPRSFTRVPDHQVSTILQARQRQREAGIGDDAIRLFTEVLQYLAEGFIIFGGAHDTRPDDVAVAGAFMNRIRADLPRLTEGLFESTS